MYNQTGNLYKGVFDCLYKTVSTEGLLAIYKGYFAHLARILPHTVSSALSQRFTSILTTMFQILTLSLAEQTNKFIRGIEDRILSDDLRSRL
jgi:solute carrier family 25 protein 34/35